MLVALLADAQLFLSLFVFGDVEDYPTQSDRMSVDQFHAGMVLNPEGVTIARYKAILELVIISLLRKFFTEARCPDSVFRMQAFDPPIETDPFVGSVTEKLFTARTDIGEAEGNQIELPSDCCRRFGQQAEAHFTFAQSGLCGLQPPFALKISTDSLQDSRKHIDEVEILNQVVCRTEFHHLYSELLVALARHDNKGDVYAMC